MEPPSPVQGLDLGFRLGVLDLEFRLGVWNLRVRVYGVWVRIYGLVFGGLIRIALRPIYEVLLCALGLHLNPNPLNPNPSTPGLVCETKPKP